MIKSAPNYGLTPPPIRTQPNMDIVPQQLKFLPEIKALQCIHVSNFKSFHQEKYIGPFTDITAIVGANGSGKSNVLEAILFCLVADKLRGAHFDVKENFYRNDHQSTKNVKKFADYLSVRLQFSLKLGNKRMQFQRRTNSNSESEYLINNQRVSREVYITVLNDKYLIVNQVCNLAIFQNTAQKVIYKNPIQLRDQFEIYSGSILVKNELVKLQKSLQEIDNKASTFKQALNKLRQQKKTITNTKNSSITFQKLSKRIKELTQKIVIAKTLIFDIELRNLDKSIQIQQSNERERLIEFNKRKAEVQKNFKKSMQLKKEIQQISNEITQIEKTLKSAGDKNVAFKEQEVRRLQNELKKQTIDLQTYQYKKQTLTNKIPQIQSSEVITEYLSIYSDWQKSNHLLKDAFEKKQMNLAILDRLIDDKSQAIQNYKQSQKKFQYKEEELKKKVKSEQENHKKLQRQLDDRKQSFKKYLKQYNEIQIKVKKQYDELAQNISLIQNLEYRLKRGVQDVKENEISRKLQGIDGYIGYLSDKIKASRSQYVGAIGAIFSSYQRYILVESNQASKDIAIKLKDVGKSRNIIILQNVNRSEVDLTSFQNEISDYGIPAFKAVIFDTTIPNLKNFMAHFLKSKVIVDSFDEALALQKKKIRGVKQIYTKNGDMIQTNGMITSSGTQEQSKKYDKFDAQVQKSLTNEIKKAKSNQDKINDKITKIRQQYQEQQKNRRQQQIKLLEDRIKQSQLQLQKLKNYKPNNKKEQAIKNAQKQLDKLLDQRANLNKNIKSTQKQIQKSSQFKQFMKKHKIQNLQGFRNANNLEQLQKKFDLKNQILKQISDISFQIHKIQSNHTKHNLEIAKKQLKAATDNVEKKQLKKNLQKKNQQLNKLKTDLSELKTVFNEVWISKIPQMQQKVELIKKNYNGNIKSLNIQYQTNIQRPDFSIVYDDTGSDYDDITLLRLNQYISSTQKQLEQTIIQKSKYVSFNIFNQSSHDEQDSKILNITQQINDKNKQLESLYQEKQLLRQNLINKKKQRKSLFLSFLTEYKANLVNTYRLLTSDPNNQVRQGEVDMFVEDEDDPFSAGGLFFIPIPPTKRFVYDVQQLSGGQKSIACLAYNYAMAITTRSPMIILDEIDAYLDESNIRKINNLIEKAKKGMLMIIQNPKSRLSQLHIPKYYSKSVHHSQVSKTIDQSIQVRPYPYVQIEKD